MIKFNWLYERNIQILSPKQKFIKDYNQREKKNWKKKQLCSDKRYSQSEKDETTKKIIDILYENNNTINSKKKDDKYYFKIISLDEYKEGKIKQK